MGKSIVLFCIKSIWEDLILLIHKQLIPKLSDFILYIIVAAGFSLRFSSSNMYMEISHKLRNLKVAVTQIAQFR